jgi:hypothetical protein
MSEHDKAFPKIKNGRALYPKVGEFIYVPTTEKPHVIGGRATVVELRGNSLYRKVVLVAEHPDTSYTWKDLRDQQADLWQAFGMTPARLPNEEERAALEAKEAAAKAAAEAKRAASEAAERAKWEPRKFKVMGGALVEFPVYETHKRGRNWVALARYNPVIAGGIDRFWFNRGAGKVITAFIVPSDLGVDDVVEFGGDYVSGSGSRSPDRWYGVVEEITASHLTLKPCKDATAAFLLSAERKTLKESTARAVG